MIVEFFLTFMSIVAVTAAGIVVAMRAKERREKPRKLAHCDSVVVVSKRNLDTLDEEENQ